MSYIDVYMSLSRLLLLSPSERVRYKQKCIIIYVIQKGYIILVIVQSGKSRKVENYFRKSFKSALAVSRSCIL